MRRFLLTLGLLLFAALPGLAQTSNTGGSITRGSSIFYGGGIYTFSPFDVGQFVSIPGAGPSGGNFVSRIADYSSNGSQFYARLTSSASTTVHNVTWQETGSPPTPTSNIGGQTVTPTGGNTAATLSNVLGRNVSVLDFGADPTGVNDSSAAFTNAAALHQNVYAPVGTYRLNNQVTLSGGQCLFGDGRGLTQLTVDNHFNSAATSVILLTNIDRLTAPCVHDLTIEFTQPTTQTSRAAFKTLAGGCTSASGGTGCQYPPAIYHAADQLGGINLWNLYIGNAWNGIDDEHAIAPDWRDIGIGSLNVGLTLNNGHDFGTIVNYEHHSQFGLCGLWSSANDSCPLTTGVYNDGNTFAAVISDGDGSQYVNWRTWQSRIQLTTNFTWGQWINLALDGDNSTFEVNGGSQSMGPQIIGGYLSGSASGANTHCGIDVASTSVAVNITNFVFNPDTTAGTGSGALCVAGGNVNVVNGTFISHLAYPSVLQTGVSSSLRISDSNFQVASGVYTASLVTSTAGIVNLTGNTVSAAPSTGTVVPAFAIGVDSGSNLVTDNNLNGWLFQSPGQNGVYGPNIAGTGSNIAIGAGAMGVAKIGTVTATANGSFAQGTTTVPLASTTGFFPGQICSDTTASFSLGAALSVQANTTLTFGALPQASSGAADTITCTSALGDSAIGNLAGKSITTGTRNTFVGTSAGQSTTTTGNNTFIGTAAGAGNTGNGGTGVGQNALVNATNGGQNTAFGNNAGAALTTGGSNFIMGTNVGSAVLTTGSRNLLFGSGSNCDTATASTSDTFSLCASRGPTPLLLGNLAPGTLSATINGGLTVQNTVEPLVTDLNQASATTLLPFKDVQSLAAGMAVSGANISGGTTISSIVGTTTATRTANGAFASGQTVIPMSNTGAFLAGQQCVDTTQTNVIGDGNVIASIAANVSISLTSNVANNSAGTQDTIKCDPVVTLNQVTGGTISSGGAVTFSKTGTGLIIAPNLPTSCAGQATGTLWNNSGAVGVC